MRPGLQLKLVIGLVFLVAIPLVASWVMLDQITTAAGNFGSAEAKSRAEMIEQVVRVYRDPVITTKSPPGAVAHGIAVRPGSLTALPRVPAEKLLATEANLRAIAVLRPDGSTIAEASRPADAEERILRDTVVDQPFPAGGSLRLTFRVIDTEKELQRIKQSLDVAKQFAAQRTGVPTALRNTFLVFMLLFVAAGGVVALLMGRSIVRKIEKLHATATKVSRGQREARVDLPGNDEIAELGHAFNSMLDEIEHARGQVEYLQRIGAWQDVARRLAHEIKNPLTPIQLSAPQTVSS